MEIVMKDLVIGCSTNYDWNKLKYWINSINRSGFTGDKVMVLMNCDVETAKKVLNAGFKVIAFNQNEEGHLTHSSQIPVHVERFLHMYNYLRDSETKYRYVITTDVKDVVFQKNPSEFIENCIGDNQLIFASESIHYKNEPWGDNNLLETFGPFFHNIYKENEIYNVGVLAGKANSMQDLFAKIFVMSTNRPIPIVDQSTFNFMVSMEPYKSTSLYLKSENSWAAQLGTTADPSKIEEFKSFLLEPSPVLKSGNVVTSTGKVFTIVHQYDRIPEWKKIIEETYND
jgi:hypothetical protein